MEGATPPHHPELDSSCPNLQSLKPILHRHPLCSFNDAWDIPDRAALELKSQVGSFGNNFNNRTEEAIGTAQDLWTAFREGSFGEASRPFVGWLMLVEDAPRSRRPIQDRSLHFPIRPEFQGASYIERYNLLCKKLVQEQLYTTTAVLASPHTAIKTGAFMDVSDMTSLKTFGTNFAGHIASEAAR